MKELEVLTQSTTYMLMYMLILTNIVKNVKKDLSYWIRVVSVRPVYLQTSSTHILLFLI